MPSEQPQSQTEELSDSIKTGIDYLQYVNSHEFGEYKKHALDLASLLSNPDFAVVGDGYTRRSKADTRLEVFNCFCTLCTKAGVDVPPLAEELFLPYVPEDNNSSEVEPKAQKVLEIKKVVDAQTEQMEDVETKKQIDTLTEFLLLFADKFDPESSYGGISSKEIIALLNKKLTEIGLQPIRPDYSKLDFKTRAKEKSPEKSTNLLIVDDDFREIVNTVLSVAGWPNVTIEYFHCERDYNDKSSKENKISVLAGKILDRSPDVVLMDQGIGDGINGSDILKVMNNDPRSVDIRTVANTGGNDEELRAEGARGNFNKGRGGADGLRRAINNR
ncbi:MAG: hypothetical protein WC027_02765 [Candidatus Paceibacterota bacterium]